MNQTQGWETLTAVALLGTDRQGAVPALTEAALTPLLAQIDTTDVDGWMLSAAGLLSAYTQAGQCLPKQDHRSPEPSPCTEESYPTEKCLPFFKMVLGDEFKQALPELLSLLSQSSQCVPPQYLPQLLDWGRTHRELQALVKSSLGPRGEWLAHQNPDWSYAIATPQPTDSTEYPALWETGDRTTRLNLLQEWRQIDPNAAREQVAASWKKESAKDRAEFLACFERGLSLADEAFLETALGDRGKDVRAKAMDLLSMLTASRFSQQMALQVKDYVQIKTGQGKFELNVTLPNPADQHWKQYGLDVLRPMPDLFSVAFLHRDMYSRQGNRAILLMHLLALAPMSVWADAGTPAQWLGATTNHEWEYPLTHGWLLAAQRQGDSQWMEAFLEWSAQTVEQSGCWKLPWPVLGHFLAQKTPDFQQNWVLQWLKPAVWGGEYLEILSSLPIPWPLGLSQAALETAQQFLAATEDTMKKTRTQSEWSVASLLRTMAYSLHPDVMRMEVGTLESIYPQLQTQGFELLWQVLRFRQQMQAAIAPN